MRRWGIALAMLAVPTAAHCQDHDPQIWTYGTITAPVADKTRIGFETVHRYSGDQQAIYEDQYIFTVQREIAKGVFVTIGYNRVVSSRNGDVTATEHRPREMITFPVTKLGKLSIVGRIRAEQRFRSDDSEDGHRLRGEWRFDYPLARKGYVVRYMHEDYLNLNTTAFQRAGHERMRDALSLFIPAGKAKLELGYMNQWRFNRAPRRDLMEHGLLAGVSLAL